MRRIAIVASVLLALGGVAFLSLWRAPRNAAPSVRAPLLERSLEESEAELVPPVPAEEAPHRVLVPESSAPDPELLVSFAETTTEEDPSSPAERAGFTFRLLDPEGRPVANQDVRCELVEFAPNQRHRSGYELRTDAAGRGETDVLDQEENPTRHTLEFHVGRRGERALEASVALAPKSEGAPKRRELGDIVLSPARLLVDGRVQDSRGQPVAAGWATIETPRGARSWFPALTCKLEPDGGFAFFGVAPAPALRVVVRAQGHAPSEPLPFSSGASGLVVVVADAGRIAGSIVVPEVTLASNFNVSLRPVPYGSIATRSAEIEPDGRFELSDLPAGTFDFALRYYLDPQPLLEIRGLQVVAGETLRDPRIQGIDPSSFVRAVRVSVHLPDGRPAVGAVHELGADSYGSVGTNHTLTEGVASVPFVRTALELAVVVADYPVVRLTGVSADQELVLREPPIRARFRLADGVALPTGGVRLVLGLVPSSAGASAPALQPSPHCTRPARIFWASRELLLPLERAGIYALCFELDCPNAEPAPIPGTATVVLREGEAEPYFVVEPDPALYAQALAALR